jgi:hypothetical protein
MFPIINITPIIVTGPNLPFIPHHRKGYPLTIFLLQVGVVLLPNLS